MNKLRITAIGTCRIHTPLKRAQSRYPIVLNMDGVYGYTHTSDEALQQIRYLQGEKNFRDDVKPLVLRPDTTPEAEQPWQPSDLNIIEISSAKRVTSGDVAVQINYLYRYFADFFASPTRTLLFWSLVKRRARAELGEFLRSEPTYRLLAPPDRALLINLEMKRHNFESIKQDMAEIIERLGRDAVLFMTHVNVSTPDGEVIPSRDRVIRWVKLAAQQLDVGCFDPTEAMREFGQDRAMEKGGLDLTHFSPAFCDRVYAALHRDHVSQVFDANPELIAQQDEVALQQMLADNIDALIEYDDFVAGSRKLHDALRRTPDAVPLIQLRGKLLAKIGDYEGSIRDLREFEASSTLPEDARVALLEALTRTGNWEESLRLAEGLLGDEYESGAIYECAATAAEQLGRNETALDYWKQAFRNDRANYAAAFKGLALYSQLGLPDQLGAWRQEILEQGETSDGGAREIGIWALENGDEDMVVQAFRAIAPADIDGSEELIQGALSGGMFKAVASCLDIIRDRETARPALRRYEKIAAQVSKIAAGFLVEGRFRLAYDLASAASGVKADRLAAATSRKVVAHYRRLIRQAYAQGDYESIIATADEGGEVIFEALETALLVGVALSKLGRDDEALATMLKIHQIDPENAMAARWAGKIAASLGKYEVAVPMYAQLATSKDPKVEKFAAERVRFFASAELRTLKQFRSWLLEGRYEDALALTVVMRQVWPDEEWITGELARLNRVLRVQLRLIEKGEADEEDRERILRLLLRIQPDDEIFLRRTALEMMRQMRFEEAAAFWERLGVARPGNDTNDRNLHRCRIFAERQKKSRAARGAAAA